MTNGVELGSERLETDRGGRRELVEDLTQRGELEVVTTASGEILYILQSLDE